MAFTGAVVALVAAGCGGSPERPLSGLVRDPLPVVAAPPTTEMSGAPVTFRARPGELLVVYFGYTSCPDICPTTLADLKQALADLGERASLVDVAFVTVDPERDTPEVLRGYLASFVADGGHPVRITDPAALQATADAFGASFTRQVSDTGAVEVGHTAFLYAVDDRGRLLVQWPFGTTAGDLREDLRRLVDDLAKEPPA